MRALPGFGDDDFIACDEVDVTWTMHMAPEECPKQDAPRDDRGEKALGGAIAAAFAGPARHAYHRHPPCHGYHRHDDPAQLADRGGSHVRTETVQQCYNIDHGCAPLWCVSCRLGQRNSTRQRATFSFLAKVLLNQILKKYLPMRYV